MQTQPDSNSADGGRSRSTVELGAKPDEHPYTPRVVCAAIRVGDQIICGARHYDRLMIQQIEGRNELGKWRGAEQGFVDQWGKWMTREEAWVVASRERQIINDSDWCAGSLHSEHLY